MSCWAVIPVKPSPDRKSRLAGVLDKEERDALVMRMARHVAGAAAQARGFDRIAFIAPSSEGLPDGFPVLADHGGGLNAAAATALEQIADASRIVIVAGDLPLVTPADLELLAAIGADTAAIAPDRHGRGTNAISLPLPQAHGFAFAFGTASFEKHCGEIRRKGLKIAVVRCDGLARDVDEPADLADAAALIGLSRSGTPRPSSG